ncbi:MAG TPA: hypothetical protein VF551_00495, partial [Chthoniobacterales bacterium]
TFEEVEGGTRVIVGGAPHNATELERETFNAGQPAMQQGWAGTFERLAGHLASASRAGNGTSAGSFAFAQSH